MTYHTSMSSALNYKVHMAGVDSTCTVRSVLPTLSIASILFIAAIFFIQITVPANQPSIWRVLGSATKSVTNLKTITYRLSCQLNKGLLAASRLASYRIQSTKPTSIRARKPSNHLRTFAASHLRTSDTLVPQSDCRLASATQWAIQMEVPTHRSPITTGHPWPA